MTIIHATSGTLLNALTVLVGGTLGTVVGGRLPERFTRILFVALGLFTTVTGLHDALSARNSLVVLGGLLIGGVVGELIQIERQLDRFGAWAQVRLVGKPAAATTDATESPAPDDRRARIGQGLVTASLLFCVGPLTILGSLANGLTGDTRDLVIKSTLDGFAALALAATFGWGVLLAIATILIVQGGISLGAGAIAPLLAANAAFIPELVATGGFLLIGIGLRLLKIADLKPGNFLPALVVTPLLVALVAALPLGITP